MTTSVKNELQVYNDMISIINEALVASAITGWNVMQWAQPSIQGLKTPLVLVNYYDSKRYGWTTTHWKWNKNTQTGYGIISWLKDISIQFTFYKNTRDLTNSNTDLQSYQTSIDVANRVLAYLQSDFARQSLAEKGYWTLVSPQILNPDFLDDSGMYARSPNIRLTFVTPERLIVDKTDSFVKKQNQSNAFDNHLGVDLYAITNDIFHLTN